MAMKTICKKTVFISMPVLLVGGTEVQTLSLLRTLTDAGYSVTVCCYYEYDQSMVDRFEKAGAKVHLMKYERAQGLWYLAIGLIRLFREIKPDIIHVQYLAPGLLPIIASRLYGIKTVFATVHIAGSIAYGIKAKFLLRLAARFCTAFFCVSKGVEEFWFGSSKVFNPDKFILGRRHYTIYNAVETDRIVTTIKETNKARLKVSLGIGENTVIGIVGRLAHQKGLAVMLDALFSIVQDFPDLILLVIGRGPDREGLEQKAKSLKIDRNIKWLGEKGQEEVFELYGIMDIFVMPSLYEGFGLTAAEAMAASLPVVATKVDGLTEVIEDGVTGLLVPPGDTSGLVDSIMRLLSDKELSTRMGQEGKRRIQELFSLEKFKTCWLAAYDHLGKLS